MPSKRVDVRLKRAYDTPEPSDGTRVLMDRLWPRGLAKEHARVDVWLKEAAPSNELRIWFGHDPAKWDEFRRRYRAELESAEGQAALARLRELVRQGTVTLVYAARDTEHNNAVVLQEVLADG